MSGLTSNQQQPAFETQRELVAAWLSLTTSRIQFALDTRRRVASGERPGDWPAELLRAEAAIEARMEASVSKGSFPITWLRSRLGLRPEEVRVLWVLLAHELSPPARDLLRQLNTENAADPTTDTLRAVAFGELQQPEATELLAPDHPLVAGRLIIRTDNDAHASDHRQTWKVARRLLALAHGDVSRDPDLADVAEVIAPAGLPIGIGGLVEAAPDALAAIELAMDERKHHGGTVIVQGPRGTGRRALLRSLAARRGAELLELDCDKLVRAPAPRILERIIAFARDCRLFARTPLLRNIDALLLSTDVVAEGEPRLRRDDQEWFEHLHRELYGLLVLATASDLIPSHLLDAPGIVEPGQLSGAAYVRLWKRALPGLPDSTADQLATMYPIAPSLISAVASVARAQLSSGHLEAVRHGLRAVLDGKLAKLATRIPVAATWDSLVLPAEQRQLVEEMILRMKRRRRVYEDWSAVPSGARGLNVSALFWGPPGTGKTMAAGLIAQALAADLYMVEMSKIISKWLGETEKNLARLFEAADAGQGVLLFDEADALFGKRTDVTTSNDRWANQATDYLLTRLESFAGVCILTTNHAEAIDEAFKRRIAITVEFPMPDEQERAALWRKMLRPTIPTQGPLDFAGLARRYVMSGGYIRKAALRAAFFAADEDSPVTTRHLERAAQLEYHAMGRITPASSLSTL